MTLEMILFLKVNGGFWDVATRHAHIISSAPSNKTTLGKTQRKARTDNASPVGNTSSLLYENPSQQPIAQRLKVEVVIPDTHAALVGLLCWARFYVYTDTILIYCQSDALSLLLSNVLCFVIL
ncbi:hypothetical protein F441_06372 [Phytophthora nicotianae CJ01A1]|uniref:Uncharacterized protein n=2 Tax=Phytophthora nicotianae TaxID=4792 RepID=W2RDF0_PHYN3|nr:hypothetical protein PPTG_02476 [Phytophthora nicotianae INRA-310]ETN22575.1 hypothetical protein PPTG_02476 [Phytophthora nicotianae INRA-310]ETP19759.1 hypothetical protein F441_06372 [Phytophthora nicotianae CJ01A1]